ncbi:SspB family protein [Elioraea rosea]|uniref:SspB family protein n=1 Tax=Elioraea rosea TaxID=2492390 RepID=UPI001181EB34|nr:ClpXP protease specificity-enhancing factor SspB [Elioraea rosea]
MAQQDEPGLKDSLLPYEGWIQESLRGVLRFALDRAAGEGLPGDHHFYLTFRTDAPGVGMPDRLRAQYPNEMTIVLQHQFDDLRTTDDGFSVKLYFGGVPAQLSIPWAAITQFADPSVRFGLRFDAPEGAEQPGTGTALAPAPELPEGEPPATEDAPQVVSLDAFRKRPPKG